MNSLGVLQRAIPAFGLLAEKQAWLSLLLTLTYRKNVSLDCQWVLILEERLQMILLSNVLQAKAPEA